MRSGGSAEHLSGGICVTMKNEAVQEGNKNDAPRVTETRGRKG